jgi:Secretion system C-terminal sorting domain/SprB repeat
MQMDVLIQMQTNKIMKKIIFIVALLICGIGYSQTETGTRTITFVNPPAIVLLNKLETNSTIATPTATNPANGTIQFTITGGTKFTTGDAYSVTLKKGSSTITLDPTNFSFVSVPTNSYKCTITGLDEGTYTATITDSNSCAPPIQPIFTIYRTLNVIPSQTNITCLGANDGTINLAISGGSGAYTVKWNDTTITTKDRTGLASGDYTYTITDNVAIGTTAEDIAKYKADGLIIEGTITITKPTSPFTVALTKVSQPSPGGTDGVLKLAVGGGYGKYNYVWTKDGRPIATPTVDDVTKNSIGLGDGKYKVTVTDREIVNVGIGCAEPSAEITLKALAIKITTPTAITCQGGTTLLQAVATGGNGSYSYKWYKDGNLTGSTTSENVDSKFGLYKVEVTDAENTTSDSLNLLDSTNPAITATVIPTPANCFGGSDGTATVKVTNPNVNTTYTFTWYIKTGSTYQELTTGIISQATESKKSGLSLGDYKVTILGGGCLQEFPFAIGQPTAALSITSSSVINTTGFEKSDGNITITIANGTPGYTYEWKDALNNIVGTSPALTNVKYGAYTVLVTDANACPISDTFTIQQPTKPVLTENHLQARCNGLSGSLVATAIGGAAFGQNQKERTYTFKLKNTATGLITTITGNEANFTTIADGDYELAATDSGGIDSNVILVNFKQPDAITLTPSQTNVNCYNGSDGTASVVAKGGTGTYTNYIWKRGTQIIGTNAPEITGLKLGNYSVEVRDSNYNDTDLTHCIASASFTITEPTKALTIISDSKTDVTGYNLANGTITVNVDGGTPDYVYTWTKVGDSSFVSTDSKAITGLAPGDYKVVVTDKNKVCSVEKPFTIIEPKKLEFTISQISGTAILCKGNKNAKLFVSVSGGVAEYTYKWYNVLSPSLTLSETNTITDLGAGTYQVDISDAKGNVSYGLLNTSLGTNTFTIAQPDLIEFETIKTDATCTGISNGTIAFKFIKGGSGQYNITCNGGVVDQTNRIITGLGVGEYDVNVTEKNDSGCKAFPNPIKISIGEPTNSPYVESVAITPASGKGLTNGSITIVAAGGTVTAVTDYKYQWYQIVETNKTDLIGKTNAVLDNVGAGVYNVVITDKNSPCANKPVAENYTILEPNVLTLDVKATNALCNNGRGSINATATGGATISQLQSERVYTYELFKKPDLTNAIQTVEANTANFAGLETGDYVVIAKDANQNLSTGYTQYVDGKGVVTTNSVVLTEPEVITIVKTKKQVLCYQGNEGSISINVSGGTPTIVNNLPFYDYVWTKDNKSISFKDPKNPSGLTAGTYTVEVQDANYYINDPSYCKSNATFVLIDPADFGFDISKITYVNPLTATSNDGALHFEITGGKPNYTYVLYTKDSNGIPIEKGKVSNSALKTVDFNALSKDSYFVSVTDATGCVKYSNFDFKDNPLTINIQQTKDITCNKGIGTLQATIIGGFGTKTMVWYNKIGNIQLGTNENIDVPAGTYYAIVKDNKNVYVTSNEITIIDPDAITVQASQEPVKCKGDATGAVTLTATGGDGKYKYTYAFENVGTGNWINFQSGSKTAIQQGLKTGNYTFTITDSFGCNPTTATARILVTEPSFPITIASTTKTPTLRFGSNEGTATVTPQGGNGSYTYEWFRRDNSKINQTTATATKLFAGFYYVIVKDAKGCSVTSNLIEIIQPSLLLASVAIQNPILCNGSATASIKATASGGFLNPGENYTYKWFAYGTTNPVLGTNAILANLKASDSYYVVATDSNAINALSGKITITEPTAINNFLTADYTLCGDGKDWTIVTNPTEGTPPYSYIWNTGETTPTINVVAGTYNVTVSDKNGCSINKEIVITVPVHLTTSEQITKPTCYAGSDARIELTTSGGRAPYTYLWDTGEKTNVLSNASAKAYSVTITDAKGCAITRKYTIDNPTKDVINIGDDVTLCKGQSLTINASIKDNKAIYSWTADNGFVSDKPIITIAKPGTYSLTVTNNLGCQATDAIKIESDNIDIGAEFAVSSQVFVNEKFVIVDISNPQPDNVEWVLPVGANVTSKNKDFAEMSFSKAGEYELTLNTKKGNCTAFQTKKILVVEGEYIDPELDAKNVFDLKIYPNPSDGNFTIDVKLESAMPVKIKLYNLINNAIIDSKSDQGKSEYTFGFNLSGLASGVYYVLFESKQGNKLRKIIMK